jgi:uncharacterized protein (DUF2252 family)
MSRRPDAIERITRFNRGRDPERLALKYEAMQDNARAFFRGACHLFGEDWPQERGLNDAPLVWICGDLHIENFGTYRGDNRFVYFDIADFDEALLAPCTWDLARLLTSALIAAKVHELKRKHAVALCNALLDAYTLALRDGKARWIERGTAQGLIGAVLAGLEKRTQRAFITKRTVAKAGKIKLRIDGTHTLAIGDRDRKCVKRFMRAFAAKQANPMFFKVLDVARRVAGTGSLGLPRYTVLVDGQGAPAEHLLLDLKFAPPSALARYVKTEQPQWDSEAVRVVEVERRMQAIAPALLRPVMVDLEPYVLRELMPSQDKLDLDAGNGNGPLFEALARDLGFLVAWSELRSSGRDGSATVDELMAFAAGRRWRKAVLGWAEEYERVAERDWREFREAYQDNAVECLE